MRDNTALAGVLLAGAVLLGVYAASGNSSASRDSADGTRINAPLTDVQIDRDKTRVKAPFVDIEVPRNKSEPAEND